MCAKLQNAKKKSAKIIFGDYEKKPGIYID